MHISNHIADHNRRYKFTSKINRIILFIAIIILFLPTSARAADDDGIDIDSILEKFDFTRIGSLLNEKNATGKSINELIGDVIESGYDIDEVINQIDLRDYMLGPLKNVGGVVLKLFIITIIAVLVKNIGVDDDKNFFEKAVVLLAIIMLVPIIIKCSQMTLDMYDNVKSTGSVIIPVLAVLLTAIGGIGSAGMLQTLMLIVNDTMLAIMSNIVVPVVLISSAIGIVSPLVDRDWLKSIFDGINTSVKWAIGIIMTVITAFFSIRTMSIASVDGIMLRTAEYAIDDMIPVVGGALSDITGVMAGGIMMIKNAIGVIALILVALDALVPLIYISLTFFIFKVGATASKMIGADMIFKMYDNMSKSILLFIVCCVTIMAIVMIIIIISMAAANRVMMYR